MIPTPYRWFVEATHPPGQTALPRSFGCFVILFAQFADVWGSAQQKTIKFMSEMQHNCITKTAMSGVAGFGLGGVFGMFMASVRYLSPPPPPPPPTREEKRKEQLANTRLRLRF